jgi:hypothetical protein
MRASMAVTARVSRSNARTNREFTSAVSLLGFGALPLRIYKVQSDGGFHFVEAMQTFGDAKERERELGEIWPGHYVI